MSSMMRICWCCLFIFTDFLQIFEVDVVLAADNTISIDTNLTTSGWYTNESIDTNLTTSGQYTNEKNNQVITDCRDTLVSSEGTITSPDFGEALLPGFHCDWLVILPEGSSVRLNFSRFDLPLADGGHCKNGFLLLGTFTSDGNRKSDLGPVCGTDSPGEISLPTDKFWVSLYRGISGTRQDSHGYKGFSLSYSQVLKSDQESDSTSGIEPGWYTLIVIAAPLLLVIPLYLCLRRRQSIPLYCSDQDSSETVIRRFQKKHRPYHYPEVCRSINEVNDVTNITKHSHYGGSGDYENVKNQRRYRDDFNHFKNLYASRSSFPSTDGSLDSPVFLEELGNNTKTHLPINTTGNFLTLPVQNTRKSRTSYLSILPDFESTFDHGKIQSKESLNPKSPQSHSQVCVDRISGRSMYTIPDQLTHKHPIIRDQLTHKHQVMQYQPTHKRSMQYQTTYKSPVMQDQLTHKCPVIHDKPTHKCPVVQNQLTHKSPMIRDQATRKRPVIPIITITSASLRRKQRLSTVKNPEDFSPPLMDVNTGQRFRGSFKPSNHVKAWQSADDPSDESDCSSEPVMNSSQSEFHTAKSSQDQQFGFSNASILQYSESSDINPKSSICSDATPQYHQTGSSDSNAVDTGDLHQTKAPAKMEYISETKHPEESVRENSQNSLKSQKETIHQQIASQTRINGS